MVSTGSTTVQSCSNRPENSPQGNFQDGFNETPGPWACRRDWNWSFATWYVCQFKKSRSSGFRLV